MDFRNLVLWKTRAKEKIIFIGGIPLSNTLDYLKAYLSTFDKVEKIRIPRKKDTGELKGYAKAVLATKEGVDLIMNYPSIFLAIWR